MEGKKRRAVLVKLCFRLRFHRSNIIYVTAVPVVGGGGLVLNL